MLDVADGAFVLALRLGAGRATDARSEAVVPAEIDGPPLELDVAPTPVRDDCGLLIVDRTSACTPPKHSKARTRASWVVLGILAVDPPEVETMGVA